jgi:Domain of unknown function (DUF4292)
LRSSPGISLLVFLLTALTFIFSSCSAAGGDDKPVNIPAREIKQRVNSNSELIETLEASGNISFDSPEQSGSGWVEVKIRKPDTVLVKIEGPFGISIANALITRNDFIYYNAQENKAIIGPSSDINIGAILRIKVSFEDLICGLTGGFKFEEIPEDSSMAESENNLYLIRTGSNGSLRKFHIDPSSYSIINYNSYDQYNSPLVEVNYSNYNEESASGKKVNFPATIRIKNPEKKQSVYVDYVSREINKPGLSFRIKVPKSAKVVKWE